jgi:aryl-alcohol dehydrogenase
MRTQAAVAYGKGQPFTIEEVELAEPAAGEVLVRVVAAGLCETDLMVRDEWYPVPFPAVLGHEGAGIVEAVGKGVRRVAAGDAVVLAFLPCGGCGPCQLGRTPYCHRMLEHNLCTRRLDGSTGYRLGGTPLGGHFFGQSSFARHSLADERTLVKVPDSVEPALLELLGPLETTGNAQVLRAAADATAALGTCAVIGPAPVGTEAVLDVNLLLCGRTLRGIMGGDTGPGATLPALLALHRQGLFPFDRLTRCYPLEDINQAVDDTVNGAVFKPILRMV